MKNLYNYTKAWKNPYKFYNFKNYIKFRNGIKFTTILIFGLLELLFYIIDDKLNIVKFLGISYYIIPLGLTYFIVKMNVDGKNLHSFFMDYITWKYNSVFSKKTYSYDKEVLYRDKDNKFL